MAPTPKPLVEVDEPNTLDTVRGDPREPDRQRPPEAVPDDAEAIHIQAVQHAQHELSEAREIVAPVVALTPTKPSKARGDHVEFTRQCVDVAAPCPARHQEAMDKDQSRKVLIAAADHMGAHSIDIHPSAVRVPTLE